METRCVERCWSQFRLRCLLCRARIIRKHRYHTWYSSRFPFLEDTPRLQTKKGGSDNLQNPMQMVGQYCIELQRENKLKLWCSLADAMPIRSGVHIARMGLEPFGYRKRDTLRVPIVLDVCCKKWHNPLSVSSLIRVDMISCLHIS